MKRLYILVISCLLLFLPLISSGQVTLTGKGTGTVSYTNNADDSSIKEAASNLYIANAFYSINTLTANSATPNIATYPAYKTANTSATTITNFLGIGSGDSASVVWKTIVVLDANTTIQHGTNIDCGVDDMTFKIGDVLAIVWVNNKWRCFVLFFSTL